MLYLLIILKLYRNIRIWYNLIMNTTSKPNCRCSSGEGHKSLYLSSYYNGKTQLDSVPKSYQDKVSQCIKDYEDITMLFTELSCINLELFRRREIDL